MSIATVVTEESGLSAVYSSVIIHGNIFCQDPFWICNEKEDAKLEISDVFVLLYWYIWFNMRNDYNTFRFNQGKSSPS